MAKVPSNSSRGRRQRRQLAAAAERSADAAPRPMQALRAPLSRGRGSGTVGPTSRFPDGSSEVPFAFHRSEGAMPQATGAVLGSFASPSYVLHVPAVPLQPNEFGSHPQHLARRLEPHPQGSGASLAPVSSAPAYVSQPGNGLGSAIGGEHDCVVINWQLVSITQLRMNHVNQIPAAHGTMGAHGTGLRGAPDRPMDTL